MECARVFATLTVRALLAAALAGIGGLLVVVPAVARAETLACTTLASLPATISVAGNYCLQQDFNAAYADLDTLRIAANDVVLDCNGHGIRNSDPANTAVGIRLASHRRGVTVRNCVLQGFRVGLLVDSTLDPGATANRIEGNTVIGSREIGLQVIGSHNLIAGNRIHGTSGDLNGSAIGILLYSAGGEGTGNVVRDNVIGDFHPTLPTPTSVNVTEGISFNNVHDTEIAGNVVTGLQACTGGGTLGIRGANVTGAILVGNLVSTPRAPGTAPLDGVRSAGIMLQGTPEQQATNVCRDNVVGHFEANIDGCVASGNTTY